MLVMHAGLSCLELEPSEREANAAVIWLHGLGASHGNFLSMVPRLTYGSDYAVRFIFPQAPTQAVTLNGGIPMAAWFDIRSLGDHEREDAEGLQKMATTIGALIDREIAKGIPAERIVLVGFSQGGAMVLHTALYSKHRLAGVIGLSCYLPLIHRTAPEKMNVSLPIFLAHGEQDEVVKLVWAQASYEILEKSGISFIFKVYPELDHSICPEEVVKMHTLLKQWLDN